MPAITTCGRTDNVYGAMEGMAAVASEVPEATARQEERRNDRPAVDAR